MTKVAAIAVVIPFVDEAAALPDTLSALAAAIRRAPGAIEVIAVDSGSRDASRAILAEGGVRTIDARRGRAAQMNAGARATDAPTLLFLHADTQVPVDAFEAIAQAARSPDFVYGGFRHRFDGDDRRLALISRLHNFRCSKAKTFYGDQAMFCARSAFERVGGFREAPLEDIVLCQRLRALGEPAFVDREVVTSARKFVAMGVWRSFGRVLAILVCHRVGWPLPRAFFADVR